MSNKTKTSATKDDGKPALLPKLRFPEFQDAEGWEVGALGKVAEFVSERISLERVELENYVSTENILPDYGGITRASKLPTTGSVTRFRPNDTLVSNIRPYLKKVWFSNKDGGASNDVIVIRAKHKLFTQYLPFLLKNDSFIDYVMTGAKGVKMPRGDIDSMKEYPAFFPALAEQQKIADCLSSMDEVIAAQAWKLDALKTHKKGLIQQLFPDDGATQPRLRFPGFENAGNWDVRRLDSIGRVIRGASPRPQGDPRYYGGPVPRLMVQDVTRDGKWVTPRIDSLTNEGAKLSRPCSAGTLTIVCSGTVGVVSFLAVDACIHDGFLALIDINESIATKDFLFHSLSTLRLQFEEGATHGGVFTNLTTSGIQQFEIKCPKPAEQQRIAACLSNLDDLITTEIQKISVLRSHKKGLMQQLFPSPEDLKHE
ncbi:restriction endonuclease subunit S [Polaromonas jejuensis]|uniref:Restriction endonuclease subunit S n=1 Tax=Polaromonas jejuensis TaxID=457502 RepID=A0ABW0Q5I2_9BURK|nr:restriction endonuclease subunit S [Polaromonas jejuensis]